MARRCEMARAARDMEESGGEMYIGRIGRGENALKGPFRSKVGRCVTSHRAGPQGSRAMAPALLAAGASGRSV